MLRIVQSASADAAKRYFSDGLSREAYYAEGQEMVGHWRGKGAKMLGLTGPVQKSAFDLLCDNINPVTSGPLTSRTRDDRRPGYDFNFNLPKSLSLAYMWRKEDREQILEVIVSAIRATMDDIERAVETRVRIGKHGSRVTGNLVSAEYFHFTARPVEGISDPHLHAHIYVFNGTFDPVEKKWKAIDIAEIKANGSHYQTAFLMRVAMGLRELGYGIRNTNGSFELAGISRALIEKFSLRTKVVEEKAKELGITSAEDRDGLAALTRENKSKDMTIADLEPHWWARLSEQDRRELERLGPKRGQGREAERSHDGKVRWRHVMESANHRESIEAGVATAADMKAVELAIKHLFHTASVATEQALLSEAFKRGYSEATMEGIKAAIKEFPLKWFEKDGRKVVTTAEVILQEERIAARSRAGIGKYSSINPGWIISDERLNSQQRAAVLHILSNRDFVTGIIGKPGTGKTTALREAALAIKAAGHKVMAFAPTAIASRGTLRESGFSDAETLDKLFVNEFVQRQSRGAVWFVDEAGLASARHMDRLLALAEKLGARVVLVGDTAQHHSVERGDAFRLLQEFGGVESVTIDKIQRQSGLYKRVVEQVEKGRYSESLKTLLKMKEVSIIPDINKRYEAVAAEFIKGMRLEMTTLLVAPTRAECELATRKIREKLKTEGLLGPGRSREILRNLHFSPGDANDRRCFKKGMVVKNMAHLKGYKLGEQLEVVRADEGGVQLRSAKGNDHYLPFEKVDKFNVYVRDTIEICPGERVRVTLSGRTMDGHAINNRDIYTVKDFGKNGEIILDNDRKLDGAYPFLDYGFAHTSHSAQSRTVDWILLAQSAMISYGATDACQYYTAISRGRVRPHLFTDNLDALRELISQVRTRDLALELVYAPEQDEAQAKAVPTVQFYVAEWQPPQIAAGLSDILGQCVKENVRGKCAKTSAREKTSGRLGREATMDAATLEDALEMRYNPARRKVAEASREGRKIEREELDLERGRFFLLDFNLIMFWIFFMPQGRKNAHAVALRKLGTLKKLGRAPDSQSHSERKNPHAVALGRLGAVKGASKGGKIGSDMLSPEQRRERALKAALARWNKKPKCEETQNSDNPSPSR